MESKINRRIFVGAAFLIIGLLLTFDNLEIFRFNLPYYLFRWHSILIIVGVFMLSVREKVGLGITLLIIGGIFLLDDMADYYYWNFGFNDIFDLWPLALVGVGLSLILKRNSHKDEYEKKSFENELDYVDELAVFSGAERVVTSKEFKGGKLTSIFGGTSLNLINSDLAWGTNVLDVFVLFGGCDIRVPADMNVKVKVTAIFGGFSDERKVINENDANDGKELVIKGLVLFGGGEVK
ncbi:LiaF transmembrane domain-containing protein [Roseivirga misakiensis]|nr:LiaF domain-containing protein [Roseivirga misakiensis]